ncbi:MAG: hypothetical protein PHG19_10085 [Anaerotignum sp.]|nr:hypothetical protein [Anaerotignum sp.]
MGVDPLTAQDRADGKAGFCVAKVSDPFTAQDRADGKAETLVGALGQIPQGYNFVFSLTHLVHTEGISVSLKPSNPVVQ